MKTARINRPLTARAITHPALATLMTAILIAAFAPTHLALSQELPLPIIEHHGLATVEAMPDRADFWLHFITAPKASHAQATDVAQEFRTALETALKKHKLVPLETYVSAPAIEDVNQTQARVTTRLTFSLANLATVVDESPTIFAKLCDDVLKLATALQCEVQGPLLSLADAKGFEASAVAKAIENALPLAQSAADAMRVDIASVAEVIIAEIAWGQDPAYPGPQQDLKRLSCTAKVKVAYYVSQIGQ